VSSAKDEAMSKPNAPDGPSPAASRPPKSGRKEIDPKKYQMNTVPNELVAKLAQIRIEGLPEAALKPPPIFDQRPIIGTARRLGVTVKRNKFAFAVGGVLLMFALGGLVRMIAKADAHTVSPVEGNAVVQEAPIAKVPAVGVQKVNSPEVLSTVATARNEPHKPTAKATNSANSIESSVKPTVPNTKRTQTVERELSPLTSGKKAPESKAKPPKMPFDPIYKAE